MMRLSENIVYIVLLVFFILGTIYGISESNHSKKSYRKTIETNISLLKNRVWGELYNHALNSLNKGDVVLCGTILNQSIADFLLLQVPHSKSQTLDDIIIAEYTYTHEIMYKNYTNESLITQTMKQLEPQISVIKKIIENKCKEIDKGE